MEFLNNFLKAFIPMFVAVDAIGAAPFFIGITESMDARAKKKLIVESIATATLVAVAFVFGGRALFRFLKIEIEDFMIAGGAVIFIIAVHDLLAREKARVIADPDAGVVPLGTPLLAGPAVLATAIITVKPYGMGATLLSIIANFLIAGGLFAVSGLVIKIIGRAGARALSKIMALILCAYGVMMVREGLVQIVTSVK